MSGPLPRLPGPLLTRKVSHLRVVPYPTEDVPQQATPTDPPPHPSQRTPEDTCISISIVTSVRQANGTCTTPLRDLRPSTKLVPQISSRACPRNLSHRQTSSVSGPSWPSSQPPAPVAWFPVTLAPCALQMVSPRGQGSPQAPAW